MLQSAWVGEKRAGYVMGLIGANGAGKTTAIRCLLGRRGFEVGEIELLGPWYPGRSPCASTLMALLTLSWALFAVNVAIHFPCSFGSDTPVSAS
jgi:ABC-type uncharacterized transport system ATPase subunit